ncbi:MAG: hypothetical protein HY343_06540 [Lentisphaerae bacterium]|nr:hypothetical protein [Lentisphaerota bacterium]
MNTPHRLSETIASLIREMESALAEGQMDRFQELAKRRSHALQTLCMRNPAAGGEAGAESMAQIRRDILAKAINDNERLIGMVALAKQEVGKKIEKLAVKKNAARQINQRYHQLVRSGCFCLARG